MCKKWSEIIWQPNQLLCQSPKQKNVLIVEYTGYIEPPVRAESVFFAKMTTTGFAITIK